MSQNGISSLDPNQLYQFAYSPLAGTPSTVSDAAKWMLSHPDTLNQIETHDVPGSDGIAGANDFQWAAQGGLDTSDDTLPEQFTADGFLNPAYAAAMINAAEVATGSGSGSGSGTGMDTQSASGALAGYMSQNSIPSLNPNQLYQLAYSPKSGTPSAVSDAAKWMLSNPSTFNQIETHDVPGSDGIAGANDFQWAAQGGLGTSPMNAQSAAGALSGYMSEQGVASLNPNQLYQLAYSPKSGTPSGVSDAAKWMLKHPGTYNQLETHDVAGSDGIAGANDFQWAAQGGLEASGSDDDTDGSSATADDGDAPKNAQSASGALSAYMGQHGIPSLNPNQLYQLAYSPKSGTPSTVSDAAKWMLSHPGTFNKIEMHDVPGSDGIAGANDFEWAAQGGLASSAKFSPKQFA
ncbi:hypothetical protein NDK50_25960 [Paraburkholderia bryophila]|uniref:hypothetical protein n=1 Tax=Paraburkholderia bryophila TaxID=420952 RepID=UPI00234A1BC3|nr:hypothetical protein [Paraburkholderia bryophila]WCM24275.1 hypothetical protein NDK50_25960 [Paraburkholderia bryophila]